MIVMILIVLLIGLALGYGAYYQAEQNCLTEQDKLHLKNFRNKLYLNWGYYAVYLGRLRQHIVTVKKEEENVLEKTYKGDPDAIALELFSSCFNLRERRGAELYAQYVLKPLEEK